MGGRAPIRKVRAAGAGGLATTLVVLVAEVLPNVAVPAPLAALVTLLAATGAAYQTRSAPGEAAPETYWAGEDPPDVRLP